MSSDKAPDTPAPSVAQVIAEMERTVNQSNPPVEEWAVLNRIHGWLDDLQAIESAAVAREAALRELVESEIYQRCRLMLLGGPGATVHIDPDRAPLLFELRSVLLELEALLGQSAPERRDNRLTCMDCSAVYEEFPLDTTLPDEQWRRIHPRDGGVLCASCIVKRAAKLPNVVAVRAVIEFAAPGQPEGTRPEGR